MNRSIDFLVHHGAAVLFAAVFVEQIGVPLPALLWLFAAGALVGSGQMNLGVALGAATFGSLLADMIWFFLGRHYGHRVLGLLCRISLEPDSCVRRTQDVFARRGMKGIVAAKFIPGLSTLAPPLAGTPVSAPAGSFYSTGRDRCSMSAASSWLEFCSAISWNRSWPRSADPVALDARDGASLFIKSRHANPRAAMRWC